MAEGGEEVLQVEEKKSMDGNGKHFKAMVTLLAVVTSALLTLSVNLLVDYGKIATKEELANVEHRLDKHFDEKIETLPYPWIADRNMVLKRLETTEDMSKDIQDIKSSIRLLEWLCETHGGDVKKLKGDKNE